MVGLDHCLQHLRQFGKRGFNLAEFNAVAAHLDLVIDTAVVVQNAVRSTADDVARAINLLAVCQRAELLRREFGLGDIAAAHQRARNAELATLACGHRAQLLVEHIETGVGDGLADRQDAFAIELGFLHRVVAGEVGGFGRPVGVDDLAAVVRVAQPVADARGVQAFATGEDHFEAGELPVGRLGGGIQQAVERRRYEGNRRHALAGDGFSNEASVVALGLQQHHGAATEQRPKDALLGDVVGDAGEHNEARARVKSEALVKPLVEVDRTAMEQHGALGCTCRATGVDAVDLALRPCGFLRIRRAVARMDGVITAQHGQPGGCCTRGKCGVADDGAQASVLSDEVDALIGEVGVHRHIGAACLEDGKYRDDEVVAALMQQADAAARHHPLGDQRMRQLVGAGIEAGVAQALCAATQGDRRRGSARLRRKQCMHGGMGNRQHHTGEHGFYGCCAATAHHVKLPKRYLRENPLIPETQTRPGNQSSEP